MNVQTENDISCRTDTYETTCDTFHTAQTNCSNLSSPTIAEDEITPLSSCTLSSGDIDEDVDDNDDDDDDTISDGIRKSKSSPSSSMATNTDNTQSSSKSGSIRKNLNVPNAVMSDSGVCLDTVKSSNLNHMNDMTNSTNMPLDNDNPLMHGACNSDDETNSCSSCEISGNSDSMSTHCPMHSLRRKIAAQKALIMKNLEMNVNKSMLDEQIAELQELQKRYIKIEKHMLETGQHTTDEHQLCCQPQNNEELEYDNEESQDESAARYRDITSSMDGSSYMPNMTRSWSSIRDFCKLI